MVHLNGLQVQKVIGQGHNGIKMRSLEMILCLIFLAIKIHLVQFAESLRYACTTHAEHDTYFSGGPGPNNHADEMLNGPVNSCRAYVAHALENCTANHMAAFKSSVPLEIFDKGIWKCLDTLLLQELCHDGGITPVSCHGLDGKLECRCAEEWFECFANNTIQVYNPNPSFFVDVTANNSISKCITAWHDDTHKDIVKITECSKNEHILVGFSSKPFSLIQGGRNATFAYFNIFCNEIPKEGVEKLVHNGATAIIPTKVVGSVTPYFALMGHLYADNKKSTAVSSAHLGTQLYWVIKGPEMYSLLPSMCKAYPGLDASGDILQIIIFSGCSQNKDLVSDFTVVGSGELSADLYAFRFHQSPLLTLVCDVRVCPIGSHACHYKCTRGFRQITRDVPDELEDNGTTTETVVTHLTIETDIESNFASASKGCVTTVKFVTSALLLQRAFYYAYVIIS